MRFGRMATVEELANQLQEMRGAFAQLQQQNSALNRPTGYRREIAARPTSARPPPVEVVVRCLAPRAGLAPHRTAAAPRRPPC